VHDPLVQLFHVGNDANFIIRENVLILDNGSLDVRQTDEPQPITLHCVILLCNAVAVNNRPYVKNHQVTDELLGIDHRRIHQIDSPAGLKTPLVDLLSGHIEQLRAREEPPGIIISDSRSRTMY
jgi:hypothetical protein